MSDVIESTATVALKSTFRDVYQVIVAEIHSRVDDKMCPEWNMAAKCCAGCCAGTHTPIDEPVMPPGYDFYRECT